MEYKFIYFFQKTKKMFGLVSTKRIHANTDYHNENVNSDEKKGRGTFLETVFFSIPGNPVGTSRLPDDGVHRTLVVDTVRDSDNAFESDLFTRVRLRRCRDVRTQYYI